jgi:capsular polysaccharide transport system permease protein
MLSSNTEVTLLQSLVVQRRVLYALMMRELITRFGRENLGVLWLVGEPMIFTLGVATMWSALGLNHGHGISVVAFAVTGYSSVLMWRNATSRCGAALESNKPLLYHRSVQVIDVFITRIVLEICGATASIVILSSLFTYIGGSWLADARLVWRQPCPLDRRRHGILADR